MNKNRSFFFARFSQVTLNGEYVLISFMYNNISWKGFPNTKAKSKKYIWLNDLYRNQHENKIYDVRQKDRGKVMF